MATIVIQARDVMVEGRESGKTGSNSKYILVVKVLEFADAFVI